MLSVHCTACHTEGAVRHIHAVAVVAANSSAVHDEGGIGNINYCSVIILGCIVFSAGKPHKVNILQDYCLLCPDAK